MKKSAIVAGFVAIIALLALSSCDAMFESNVFKQVGLGQVDVSKVDMTSASDIKAAATSSPDFYSKLSASQAADAIKTLTAGKPSNENLVLAATIQIETGPAADVVKNFANAIVPLTQGGNSGPNVGSIVQSILPASALPDPSKPNAGPSKDFLAIVASMNSASGNFTKVATNISTNNATLPSLPVQGGATQDTAFYAIATMSVAAATPSPAYLAAHPGVSAETAQAGALWDAVKLSMNPKAGTVSPVTFNSSVIDVNALTSTNTTKSTAPVNVIMTAANIKLNF